MVDMQCLSTLPDRLLVARSHSFGDCGVGTCWGRGAPSNLACDLADDGTEVPPRMEEPTCHNSQRTYCTRRQGLNLTLPKEPQWHGYESLKHLFRLRVEQVGKTKLGPWETGADSGLSCLVSTSYWLGIGPDGLYILRVHRKRKFV
ncbi:unnamed protein product [Protopolystoma xenopodis]|uniref:Uncharacterized protein n=1 Tax=Protopolystoma xenopodis TaxID=117903 RepID=A0A448XEH8_9PLAT|nr:unnamed protein product [Protopolystoma xenopodis]